MEMHWIKLDDLKSLPKDKAFVVCFNDESLDIFKYDYEENLFLKKHGDYFTANLAGHIDKCVAWIPLPEAPKPRDSQHYLSYE